MNGYVLALDQGTTSSRAVLCDANGELRTVAQYPLRQIYPRPGWVEHDPMDILDTILHAMAEAFEKSNSPPRISPPSASPISGKPPFYGTGKQVSLYVTPLCGSAAARRICESGSRPKDWET